MEPTPFIETLPSAAKKWFAYAVAGMVVADGQVTEEELTHLKETVRFLDHIDDVNDVIGVIRRRERVQLPPLELDPPIATKIFLELASIAISDGHLSASEANFFRSIGEKLGFNSPFCDKVIRWGCDSMTLHKQREKLVEEGSRR